MKKLALLIPIVLALLTLGCAHTANGRALRAGLVPGTLPQRVQFPLAEDHGVRIHPNTTDVTNGTTCAARVVVYGEEVNAERVITYDDGRKEERKWWLESGNTFYDELYWELHNPMVPVLVLFYRDPEKVESYLGAAWRTFRILRGFNQNISWVVTPQEVRTVNGLPLPDCGGRTALPVREKVNFPRLARRGRGVMQILDNTPYLLHPQLKPEKGKEYLPLRPGWVRFVDNQAYFTQFTRSGSIPLVLTDEAGNLVGTSECHFAVPPHDIWAFQCVPSGTQFQRARR